MISEGFLEASTSASFARGASSVIHEQYRSWRDSIRLDNLDAEAVIIPAIGAIARYGPSGEENFLWENLAEKSRQSRKRDEIAGSSSLPWPHDRWPVSESELSRRAHELRVITHYIVELESELPGFDARLTRQIALAPHGMRLTTTTSINPIAPRLKARARKSCRPTWVPWEIAKIPTPTRLAIRIDPLTDLPGGHKLMRSEAWETVRRVGDDILMARCPRKHPAKFGCDGDLIAAEIGDWLFVQRRIDEENSTGRFLGGEAVQVSCTGVIANPAAGMDHFSVEFTGARGQANPSLVVQWDLLPWNPSGTDNELAALVRTL